MGVDPHKDYLVIYKKTEHLSHVSEVPQGDFSLS